MKVISTNNKKVILDIKKQDLEVFCNVLNEISNGIELKDFEKKMGLNRDKVSEMRTALNSFHRQTEKET